MKYFLLLLLSSLSFGAVVPVVGHVNGVLISTEISTIERIPVFQTTDATETTATSLALVDGNFWMVQVTCGARKSDGTVRETFSICVAAYHEGAGAQIEGSIVNMFVQPSPTYDLTFDTSSDDLRARVTGVAATTVDWTCILEKKVLK